MKQHIYKIQPGTWNQIKRDELVDKINTATDVIFYGVITGLFLFRIITPKGLLKLGLCTLTSKVVHFLMH
jgi:hypothetical protein